MDVYAPPVIAIKLKGAIIMAANTVGLAGATFKYDEVKRF